MNPAPAFVWERFYQSFRSLTQRNGFRTEYLTDCDGYPVEVFYRDPTYGKGPSILITSGIHGDEPAGPLGIEAWLRHGVTMRAGIFLVPALNPRSLVTGTRESPEGIDLNRDFSSQPQSKEVAAYQQWLGKKSFDVALCLHEDSDGTGFYLYSHDQPRLLDDAMDALFIQAENTVGVESRQIVDDMPCNKGRMQPSADDIQQFGDQLPEALYLLKHHAPTVLTLETPSPKALTNRVQFYRKALDLLVSSALRSVTA